MLYIINIMALLKIPSSGIKYLTSASGIHTKGISLAILLLHVMKYLQILTRTVKVSVDDKYWMTLHLWKIVKAGASTLKGTEMARKYTPL